MQASEYPRLGRVRNTDRKNSSHFSRGTHDETITY